ncbi:MAG: CRTAC1 family protein, partial [Bacteroidota bacterium]
MNKDFLALILLAFPFFLQSQISFTNETEKLLPSDGPVRSGNAIGVCDINGDYKDDIVQFLNSSELYIQLQTAPNFKFQEINSGNTSNQFLWSMLGADFDNDGDGDIISGVNGRINYHKNEDGNFNASRISNSNFFVQNQNAVDINSDGLLDLFACDDNNFNKIYLNIDGELEYSAAASEVFKITADTSFNGDNSGNYGSIFSDIDNDGDLDLYISKCKEGETDPSNIRRVNQLWINTGEGNYSERGSQWNLDIGNQTWATDFGDLDNDGYLDLVMINHKAPSLIMSNSGFNFNVETTIAAGEIPIQGVLHDFDNNGYLDILISGFEHFLYLNYGDFNFVLVEQPFEAAQIESFGVGDLNSDGFLDVYAGYGIPFNKPGFRDDAVFINDGNENNYIKFSLNGNVSNKNGVGARVEIYGPFGFQQREIQVGDSYGITNSNNAHFGLGAHTTIDSVIVSWPSGIRDKYDAMEGNTHYLINENTCISEITDVNGGPLIKFCDEDTLVVSALENFESYKWNNGDSTKDIRIFDEGSYSFIATNQ